MTATSAYATASPTLADARRLRALGLSVIPIEPGPEKRPVVKWELFQQAPPTDDNLRAWFGNDRAYNIGIVTGQVSGIVVVDADSPEAEAWAETHLPPTPMQCRTAKGLHRYYRHPGVHVGNRVRIRTGAGQIALDIRGDGGFVVGPGSVHHSGHIYRAPRPWPTSLEDVPVFEPAWVAQPAPTRDASPAFRAADRIPEGQRNDHLYRLARSLKAKNLSPEAIRAALVQENAAKCAPPYPDVELEGLLTHALTQPDQGAFAGSRDAFPPAWRLLDDVALLDLPDPEYLVGTVVPRRSVGVLYGPSGACKTTMLAALMGSLSSGLDWYGCPVHRRGSAVYVAAEDPSGFKLRLRAWKAAQRLPLDQALGVYTFPEPLDLLDVGAVERFETFLRQQTFRHPLELIVVDTFAAATPGATETASEDMTLAMTHAQRWRSVLDATVLLVHHTNASGTRERGHSAMRGAADTMVGVSVVDDIIRVECSKQRNGAPFDPLELKLVPVPTGGVVLRPAHQVETGPDLTPAQRRALVALRETAMGEGLTKSEWQRSCPDISERTFHRAAKELVEHGHVVEMHKHFRPAVR